MHILDVEGGENEKFQISNTNSTPTLIFPHIKPKNNDVFAKSGEKTLQTGESILCFQVFSI